MGLLFALENEEVVGQVGEVSQTTQPMAEVEEAVAQVATEADEINQVIQASSDTLEGVETLQKVQDVAQASVDSGEGMSEDAAQVAQVVVESICNRLGIASSRSLMPAIESFGSSNTRLSATKIAIEGIGDTIKRIWEGIKRVVKNLWEKIKGFFARFFASTEKVKKAADAMRKKAKEYASRNIENKTFENKSLFKLFAFSNLKDNGKGAAKTFEPKQVVDNHLALTKFTGEFVKSIQMAASGFEKFMDLLKGKVEEDKALNTVIDASLSLAKAYQAMGEVGNIGKSIVNMKPAEGSKSKVLALRVGPFYGGKTVNWKETSKMIGKGKDKELLVINEFSFGALNVTEGDDKSDIATLTVTEIEKTCSTVEDLMKATDEFKKNQSELDKLIKNVEMVVNGGLALAKTATADMSADVRDAINQTASLINTAVNGAYSVSLNLPLGNVMVAKGLLTYCDQSLKQYAKA
jgi:hypothetical protein